MREGKNMGIMTTFKKPTLERADHLRRDVDAEHRRRAVLLGSAAAHKSPKPQARSNTRLPTSGPAIRRTV